MIVLSDLEGMIPIDWDWSLTEEEAFDNEGLYRYLFSLSAQPFRQAQEVRKAQDRATELGVKGFANLWSAYKEQRRGLAAKPVGNWTDFTDASLNLGSGRWICSDDRIFTVGDRGELTACTHPIMPVERQINVDTGYEKIKLAYRPGRHWREVVVDCSSLASAQKIVMLADVGVAVTSESARELIKYLAEVQALNYHEIPTYRSTARLGWINDKEFSPYTEDLEFDQSSALGRQYQSVREQGDFNTWKELIIDLRQKDIVYKILTAASFASVILHIVDALPSFVHLWSSMSSTGKTIGLMAAASIWGDPSPGAYVQSYNATTVAMERLAEFYNSMPLVLDELQQSRDYRGHSGVNVYKLAQGSGKSRSNRSGGLEKLPTWANFILSSGESPLVDQSDGAGALARVINIELDHALVTGNEGNEIARTLKANFGSAGRMLVEAILDGEITRETIVETYSANLTALLKDSDIQDKQAMSAAAIITGDMIASTVVTKDNALTMAELKPHLLTKRQTDITGRAYEFITEWVVSNGAKFIGIAPPIDLPSPLYGSIESGYAYIISSVFRNAMKDEGFNPDSSLSAFRKAGLIKTESDKSRFTYRKRIGASRPHTVAIKLPDDDDLPELPSF